ncbi:MAG: hypothetical protein ACRDI2_14860, partial [Chloroflexota bacterium]
MSLYHYQAELGLTPQEVWFVGYILAHRWTAALPYPSLRLMSRRTGISTQMLHRYKQSLIEKAYLVTIPRHRPSGGRTSNFYDFSGLFGRLEHLLLRDQRDTAWQPTADEAEAAETLDDPDPLQTTTDLPATHPRHAVLKAAPGGARDAEGRAALDVPQSQRILAGIDVSWGDVATAVGQRPLSGPRQPAGTSPEHVGGAGADSPTWPDLGKTNDPQETRITQERANHQIRHRATSSERETTKRSSRNVNAASGNDQAPTALSVPEAMPDTKRWLEARAALAQTMSAAAFNAWLSTLRVVEVNPAPALADD